MKWETNKSNQSIQTNQTLQTQNWDKERERNDRLTNKPKDGSGEDGWWTYSFPLSSFVDTCFIDLIASLFIIIDL